MPIDEIESRFKEVTGLNHLDLSVSHFNKGDNQCQHTTKEEQKQFSWVTTPLWLVDNMIEPSLQSLNLNSITCDACSGCGQFSIRLMRKFYDKLLKQGIPQVKASTFITKVWLPKNHWFTEFQFSNVAKLVYIFGPDINVYVGDSLNLKYSNDDDSGLMFWVDGKWVKLPLAQQLETIKDNLPALLEVFGKLERKLNPSMKLNLDDKKVEVCETTDKPKVKPPKEPKVIKKVVVEECPKPVVDKKPAKKPAKQHMEEIETKFVLGGKYEPSIDFDDF